MDVEIKFKMGEQVYSIDVHKKHLEELKDLYKALIKIGEIIQDNDKTLGFASTSLEIAAKTLGYTNTGTNAPVSEEFKAINETSFNWLVEAKKQYVVKDFGYVFEKYINN